MNTVPNRILSGCFAISAVGLFIQGTHSFFDDCQKSYLSLGVNMGLVFFLSLSIYNLTYKNPTP